MVRARNIKPGFFKNDVLVEMSFSTRLLFIGLWCIADREGRFEDRPKKIKMELFPMDDVDVDAALGELATGGFLVRYEVAGKRYVQIYNFAKHQVPHHKEVASEIPAPEGHKQVTKHPYQVSNETREAVFERDGNRCLKCGSSNDLSIDHIVPLSKGGDNDTNNLQTLCKTCNSSKGSSSKDYRKTNVGSTLNQRCSKQVAACPTDSLIPDSLIPEVNPPLPPLQGGEAGIVEIETSHDPDADPLQTEDGEPKRLRKSSEATTFSAWLAGVKERGEKPISEYDALWTYADSVGLPHEYIELAWFSFADHYRTDEKAKRKRYADWKATFLNAVKGNYRKLWFWSDRDSAFRLTTAGQQLDMALQAKEAA